MATAINSIGASEMGLLADLDAMHEALTRMGVPDCSEILKSVDMTEPMSTPERRMAWRLGWLEGRVKFLEQVAGLTVGRCPGEAAP